MTYDLIPIDEESLGPAMRACTQLQRRFVIALLELGDNNHTRALQMAGYAGESQNSLRVHAHVTAHNPKVLAAIHEEAVARIASGKIMAVSWLLKAVTDAPEWKDKLKAIDMLLNRAGMHTITEQRINGQVDVNVRNDNDAIVQIEAIAKRMNLDPRTLIGFDYKHDVVDAEFSEVQEGTAGLEDVL